MSASVVIANFGTTNIHSVINAFDVIGAEEVKVAQTSEDILNAERLVLPGQGSLATYIRGLNHNPHIKEALLNMLQQGTPTLGICLGQQCLYRYSEEGDTEGLGLIDGEVRRFSAKDKKVPHMGWNTVRQLRPHPLWNGIEDDARFYFVHSYFIDTTDRDDCVGLTNYVIDFTSVTASKNLFAVQFHPEKSAMNGLKLLGNFIKWNGEE